MKKIFLFLLLVSFSFALYPGVVTIEPIEFKDFGNASEPTFNITLQMDCLDASLKQITESDGLRVTGVDSYLKYVQYHVPLLSSGTTDSSGVFIHKFPGNVSYYTGLFTLTVEKNGYRKKELHFDISACFVNVTEPPPPPPIPPPPPGNGTPGTGNGQPDTPPPPPPLPENNVTPTPEPNLTENITEPNITGNGKPDPEPAPLCPVGFILLSALFVSMIRN
jgi:hypothetical protein